MEIFNFKLTRKIHRLFKTKGIRLSIAESCTGGLISHTITCLSGASMFFDSSIVCYSPSSKSKLLGINKSVLKKHGAISEEAAREMAEAVRKKTGADFSLAVTGNLGPTALEGKRVGLVYMAVSFKGNTESKGMIFDGPRQMIKESASYEALMFLHEVASIWT
jgi:PncC family amidohydrolase